MGKHVLNTAATFILANSITKTAKMQYFGGKVSLPVKTLINSCDVTWGTLQNNMAERGASSSSRSVSEASEISDADLNLYDSDSDLIPVDEEDEGPRPYRFEPRRRRNEEEDEADRASDESSDSEIERVGNTDWLVLPQP